MVKQYHRVLTVAGSDSCGGAGIQADLKTFSALGCYGMSVITALTAQNTRTVSRIYPVPPEFVEAQIEAVLTDIDAEAVKTGMLYSAKLIEIVARQLKKYNARNLVIDPVMIAQSGNRLMKQNAIKALQKYLMPIASVITPNLPEASAILNRNIKGHEDIKMAARELSAYGSNAVLIKGGHSSGKNSNDLLYTAADDHFVLFKGRRINTKNNHGTGCTLSSAIAAFLAKGFDIEEAVNLAKEYTAGAILAGAEFEIGEGRGPVHHFFKYWS